MGIEVFGNLRELNYLSIMVRMILALLCGGIIGFDREKKGRPAGFRTHILVCIGSALVMITSQFILYIEVTCVEGIGSMIGFMKENQMSIIHFETVSNKEGNSTIGLFVSATKVKDKSTEEIIEVIKSHEMVATAYHI